MRKEFIALLVVAACGKGNGERPAPTPPLPESAPANKEPPPLAHTQDAQIDAGEPLVQSVPEASWSDLLVKANQLKTTWETLAPDERAAFYEEWAKATEELIEKLRDNGDSDQLDKLYQQEKPARAIRFLAEEGYAYSAEISSTWLLKEFSDLPKSEIEYLNWVATTNRSDWFAEGNLETEVPHMVASYKKAVALLRSYASSFRAPKIARELDAIFHDMTALLTQDPLPYTAKRYRRHVKEAFSDLAKQKRHGAAAKAFLLKMPAGGMPYDYEEVDRVREETGMHD